MYGQPPVGSAPPPKEMPGGKTDPGKTDKKPGETIPAPGKVSAPATLVVSLPADATLTVDGRVTTSTSTTRVFVTPTLAVEGAYNLTATVVRDGQTLTQTQRVAVVPGRQTSYTFNFASTEAAVSR